MLRWFVPSLTAGLLACTDSPTGPDEGSSASLPLRPAQYAQQLRGDPLLRSVSEILGRPRVAADIDLAVVALDPTGFSTSAVTTASVTSGRLALIMVPREDPNLDASEADVLSAVMSLTLDRIAQVNAEPFSTTRPMSDREPSR